MAQSTARKASRDRDAEYAYELGAAGEPMPDWVRDTPRFRDAYLDGVPVRGGSSTDDGSAGGAGESGSKAASPAPPGGGAGRSKTPTGGGGGGGGALRGFVGTPTLRPPSHLSTADGSGFALGLVLFALGSSYLRYGLPGITGWFSAKFLNKVDPKIAQAEASRGIAPKGSTYTAPGGQHPPLVSA